MPSPRHYFTTIRFHFFKTPSFQIVSKGIVGICSRTNPATTDIDFAVIDLARMSPTFQQFVFPGDQLPLEAGEAVILKQASQIEAVHVSQKMEVTGATAHYIQVISNKGRTVESPLPRPRLVLVEFHLPPLPVDDAEGPRVVQIHVCHSLPAVDDEVRVRKLTGMVSAFPGRIGGLLGHALSPFLGLPVQNAHAAVSHPIVGTAPVQDYLVRDRVVVHGIVRPALGHLASSGQRPPCAAFC